MAGRAGPLCRPARRLLRLSVRRSVAVALTALVAGGCLPLAEAARAVPPFPDAEEVEQAKKAVTEKSREVGRIREALARASTDAEAAQVAFSAATEDFDEARYLLEQRTAEADLARHNAQVAKGSLADARREVAGIAVEQYQNGGVESRLEVLLSARGPQDVMDRAALLQQLGDQRRRTMERMDASEVVADVLQRQARRALEKQQAAARRLAEARAAAELQAARAVAVRDRAAQDKEQLLTELARLEQTSVTLQRERQEGLEAQRREREEARRRAEAERRAREEAKRRAQAEAERRAQAEAERRARERAGSGNSGGVGAPTGDGGSGASSEAGQRALAWAKTQLGLPYLWGADGPNSYDCSGLTMRAWQQVGVWLPHSSRWQYRQVRKISYSEIRKGDLVFWATNPGDPGTIHHVALWAGGGRILEAPSAGKNVRIVPMRWGEAMPYAGRP